MTAASTGNPLEDDTTARILDAASSLFAERGLNATLSDVAEAAGVGMSGVYRRFRTKDELITRLFAQQFALLVRTAKEASEREDAWLGFRDHFVANVMTLGEDRGFRELIIGRFTDTVGWGRGSRPDCLLDALDHAEREMVGHLRVLIRRAQEQGAMRADVDAADTFVLTIALQAAGAFSERVRPGSSSRAIGIILDGLRADGGELSDLRAAPLTDAEILRARTSE